MRLAQLSINGFKSFGKKVDLAFDVPVTAIVGPNGSGKSNVAEAFRWVLGEQSMKSLRGKKGEDLIFNGGASNSRGGKATVSLTFDNSDRSFGVDFEKVTISRTVHRDGLNEYHLNNSSVRLKDIQELLAKVSLGSSGHHIISQGEADRLLMSGNVERKEMIEDALGLKLYQWKIEESERKLKKTEENIKQIESLRRELGPHLRFLKKQVEKIEKANELRRDLKLKYLEYFRRESDYVEAEKIRLQKAEEGPTTQIGLLRAKLQELIGLSTENEEVNKLNRHLSDLENNLRELRNQKDTISRELGKVEAILYIKQEELASVNVDDGEVLIKNTVLSDLYERLAGVLNKIKAAGRLEDLAVLVNEANEVLMALGHLVKHGETGKKDQYGEQIKDLNLKLTGLTTDNQNLLGQIETIEAQIKQAKIDQEVARDKTRGAEREVFEVKTALMSLEQQKAAVLNDLKLINLRAQNLETELAEGAALVDREVLDFAFLTKNEVFVYDGEEAQTRRRHDIDKLKIRLEDMGAEGGDVLEEYKTLEERDKTLEIELADLFKATSDLNVVMVELKQKLATDFGEGIAKINTVFTEYFGLMFGGGVAKLEVVEEVKRRRPLFDDEGQIIGSDDEGAETQTGIDININLPRKKIKGLQMLSGGERALTSIALLFAMSSVNPPPFLILDETDAALDEANSKKYGDMVENLAKQSQLIVITHNRETMARAQILYGVTMGSEGVSKLLSIRFDDAASFAK